MSEEGEVKFTVLLIGLDELALRIVRPSLSACNIVEWPFDLEKMLEPVNPPPILVLCGPAPEKGQLIEAAQALRMNYQNSPNFHVTSVRAGYDRKDFVKNGFTDGFLLPMDANTLVNTIQDVLAQAGAMDVTIYRSVKVADLQPGTVLNFDTSIYLPANKKYVTYSRAGDELDLERAEKLQKSQMTSIYVEATQLPKFYEYSAKQVKEKGISGALGETERRDRLQIEVRHVFSGLYNDAVKDATFEQGQVVLKECQRIIKELVLPVLQGDWYSQMIKNVSEKPDAYSHAGNVATYAALFSKGLGIGDPEQIALGGLLHDIGVADLKGEVQLKLVEQMSVDEFKEYKKHPELTINIIKQRKLVVPEKLMKAILQHHEQFNGKGYPSGIATDRILPEAQVIALADQFDYLTALRDGCPRLKPAQALQFFKKQALDDPTKLFIDPELLNRVIKLCPAGSET